MEPLMTALLASLQNDTAVLHGTRAVPWPELTAFLAEAGARHDRDGSFPFDSLGHLREAGLLGLTVPRSLGGQEQGLAAAAEAVGHVATGCASTALVFAMQLGTSDYPSLRSLQSRIVASGCDVPLLTRPGHRL
jgi:alkylation response protein AidB-like acyl-CoA dehydrogenase